MQGEHFVVVPLGGYGFMGEFRQGKNLLGTPTFQALSLPRQVDDHPTHHGRRQSGEVANILPIDRATMKKVEVGLMSQLGGAQTLLRLPPQLAGRQVMQKGIEAFEQLSLDLSLALRPTPQQKRQLSGVFLGFFSHELKDTAFFDAET